MLRVLIVGLVVLVAVLFLLPHPNRGIPAAAKLLDPPQELPIVRFTDTAGRRFDLDEFRGDYSLVFFGFTNCPDVCPLALKALADARATLEQRVPNAVPRIVFVSVDPDRDSPERIADYLRNFDAAFIGATAPAARLRPLLDALGVTVEKHDHGGGSIMVIHSQAVYFLGPTAKLIAVANGPHDPATLASDYLKIRLRYQATHAAPAA